MKGAKGYYQEPRYLFRLNKETTPQRRSGGNGGLAAKVPQ